VKAQASDIKQVSGTENCVADVLSRNETNASHQSTPAIINSIAEAQQTALNYSLHLPHFNYSHFQRPITFMGTFCT